MAKHVLVVPITEAEWRVKYADYDGGIFPGEPIIVEDWEDTTETPSEAIIRLNTEVLDLAHKLAEASKFTPF